MNELPTLTTMQAIKAHVKHFCSIRPCKTCGSHERWMDTWTTTGVVCGGCERLPTLTLAQVNAQQNKHNKKVAKTRRANWSIPVVFHGMNTNTR